MRHLPLGITYTATAYVCGESPRMEIPNNMNVQAEQNAAASASAASTTASTAIAQAHQQNTSFCGRAHTSSAQEAAPAPAAVDLTAAGAAGTAAGANMSASASPQLQPIAGSLSAARATLVGSSVSHPHLSHPKAHAVAVRTCYHPPFYHTPSFITPPNRPCGCSDAPSHPRFITPPQGPRELHFITGGTQDTTPPTGCHTQR